MLFWDIYVFKITIFGPLLSSICSGYPEPLQHERLYIAFFDATDIPSLLVAIFCNIAWSIMLLDNLNLKCAWNDKAFVDFLKKRRAL